MRILIGSSEVLPYSKTGGLADMAGALAKYLAAAGHEVGVVSPYHRCVRRRFPETRPYDWKIDLPHGAARVEAKVRYVEASERLRFYFIDEANFFDRDGIYQNEGVDYNDNPDRFIFFSKCVAHMARYLPWQPEVVHAHDWQTGLAPLFMRWQAENDGWENLPATCFTIHNLAFQGAFTRQYYSLTNLPDKYFTPDGIEFYGKFNCLKAGLLYSDRVTTVSPRYAEEIMTRRFGCGLDGALRSRREVLQGVLNGVDYEEWNTETDSALSSPYGIGNMRGKRAAKTAVQREMGLPAKADVPLFGNISRLTHQKGSDLLVEAARARLGSGMQLCLLGSGDKELEAAFLALAEEFPEQAAVRIGYDEELARRIEAGSDFFLMPSRFEPCGLNQLYSLRYGAVPVVRSTGGLDDTVCGAEDNARKADGVKFEEETVEALIGAIDEAKALFKDPPRLRGYRQRGMRRDFSWERTAEAYAKIYETALADSREATNE